MINVSLAGIGGQGQRTRCEDLGRSGPIEGLAGAHG